LQYINTKTLLENSVWLEWINCNGTRWAKVKNYIKANEFLRNIFYPIFSFLFGFPCFQNAKICLEHNLSLNWPLTEKWWLLLLKNYINIINEYNHTHIYLTVLVCFKYEANIASFRTFGTVSNYQHYCVKSNYICK
jgi:hypothetical protein